MMRFPATFVRGAAVLGLLFLSAACGEDPKAPADVEIRIEIARFFPASVEMRRGKTVRWVNVLPRTTGNLRSVTSGTGPLDPDAGLAFDDTLRGYAPGNAEGESVIHQFDDPGTYPYFTRIPAGSEYGGTIVVR